MKNRHLRARLPDDEYLKLQADADMAGLTVSEHVRCVLQRDRQALSQEKLLASIDARLNRISLPPSPMQSPSTTEIEPLLIEVLLLVRELVAERNAQVLGRVANHLNNQFPGRKKI